MNTYVALLTTAPLEKPAMKAWIDHVRDTLKGVAVSVSVMKGGSVENAVLVQTKSDDRFRYVIPLSRHLSVDEAGAVADFAIQAEFEIEASQPDPDDLEDDRLVVSKNAFDDLCAGWAKDRHEAWVRERTKAGWRFAETFSQKNMTHPLLRSWEELPESHRKIDHGVLERLVDFLDQQGYAIVSKIEIDSFNKALRTNGIRIDPVQIVRNDEPN